MSLSPFKTYLNPIHHNFLQKHYTCEHKTFKTVLALTKKLQNWFFCFSFLEVKATLIRIQKQTETLFYRQAGKNVSKN